MNKEIIWNVIVATAFFQNLTKESQEKLRNVWPSLTDDQLMEILHLGGLEETMMDFIMNQTMPLLSIAKKDALKLLRTKLEKANRSEEDTSLDDLLKKIS